MTHHRALALLLVAACGRSGFDAVSLGDSTSGDIDDALVDSVTITDPDALASLQATFVTIPAFNGPIPRRSSSAALEPASPERLWIYGGYNGTFVGDLWHYVPSTNTWTQPTLAGAPPGTRERHALAWDPSNDALVIFGGQNRPTIQLVHYDTLHLVSGGSYTQIPKAGTWPAARKDTTLMWVPHLSKFLMYGGSDGPNAADRFDEVWLLSVNLAGQSATWELQTPGGVAAPAQSAGCVVYDPAGHRMIVYGGETADGVDVNTTHQYLLDTNVWQLDTVSGMTPPGTSFQQCAWDPVIGRVLVYGGQADGGTPIAGHYTYDPDARVWTSPPTVAAVGNRADGGALYSPALDGLLWYGGRTAATTYTSEHVLMTVRPQ